MISQSLEESSIIIPSIYGKETFWSSQRLLIGVIVFIVILFVIIILFIRIFSKKDFNSRESNSSRRSNRSSFLSVDK